MEEFKLINTYFASLVRSNPSAKKLKDDVFFDKSSGVVISIDTYNEGVHFLNFEKPYLVIKKILRSSISDLICKGVKPKYYFISASGNKSLFLKSQIKSIVKCLKSEQKKFDIKISGGDTSSSKKCTFTIVSLGYSKKIVERNKAAPYDDIYISGNLGDSFLGLNLLKNKFKLNNKLKSYFIDKYYSPDLPYKLIKLFNKFANSSIDVSDGLFDDLKKLIYTQNLSFKINIDKIPISKNLSNFLKIKKKNKINFIFHGDDYQTLFTAKKKDRDKIFSLSKKMNHKVTIIGEILPKKGRNHIFSAKKVFKLSKYKGYSHIF